MGSIATDLWYALRLHARHPRFALVAAFTLALGIGANTAIFSVVDQALLRRLPYADPDRLVHVITIASTPGGGTASLDTPGARLPVLRALPGVFDDLATFSYASTEVLAGGAAEPLRVGGLTPRVSSFLGVAPALGRFFGDADVAARDAVLISDAYWRRAFGGDPMVIGRTIPFGRGARVIVGVMPPTFRFFVGADVDAWWPIAEPDGEAVIGRIRSGLTIDAATRALQEAIQRADSTWKPAGVELWTPDASRGTPTSNAMLLLLLGSVGALLLIACTNVANLLLSRTLERQREIAVRSALGASRLALARQFVAEGLTLALLGGIPAVALAAAGIRMIPALVPAGLTTTVLGIAPPALDARVLAAALLVTIASGVFSAALPALRASRRSDLTAIAASSRIVGPSRGHRRLSWIFQAVQVALTVVLLLAAGLMLSAFVRMTIQPKGFDSTNLAQVTLDLPETSYPRNANRRAFMDELLRRVERLPGVGAVTIGWAPVAGSLGGRFMPATAAPDGVPAPRVVAFYVQPNYFDVTRLPLLSGRPFRAEDEGQRVAIVGEDAARRFWPGASAIGRQFRRYEGEEPRRIIGVAGAAKTIEVARNAVTVYEPLGATGATTTMVLRLDDRPAPVFAAIVRTIQGIDPDVHPRRIGLVDDLFAEFDPLGPSRFYSLLLGMLAMVGLATACVGLYGLLLSSVARRVPEIGVRMALGAGSSRVRRSVLTEALVPVLAGLALGLLLLPVLGRYLAAQLPIVNAVDPAATAVVVVVVLLVSAGAAFGPARRATRIDPMTALRAD